jgi:asparagine synthase (glutamine-hydrolysing)
MCGIAGIVDISGKAVDPDEISRLNDLLAHRGPDGSGTWFSADRAVALGHRRLAIIDPGEGGRQPMEYADGRYVIVYNGEVYNFLELRRELERRGCIFRTESDTEVILAAWQTWGEDMLLRFNGMWALAILDTKSKDLFLARDRFGIKPLLYAVTSERFVFASEQRAIVQSGLIATSVDTEVASRLLLDAFGVEGSERTLCREVRRLQAGHFLWLRKGRLDIRRWWCTVDHLPTLPRTDAERVERFDELFRDSVALRMRSDVPIGTCLSGGFDSSAVICAMAAMEEAGMGPRGSKSWRHAFVATFPGSSHDERPQAEEAAAWAGVVPTILEIGRDNALPDIEKILDDSDDVYIGLSDAPWLIYRELRRHKVLVSLDGHGADELMGAYLQAGGAGSFWLRNAVEGLLSRWPAFSHASDQLRALMLKRQGHYFLRKGVGSGFPLSGDDDPLPAHWGALNRRLYRMFHGSVMPTILRNFDRLSMAHGIEVRMPFLDWRLVTYTMALPDRAKHSDGYSKLIARQALAGKMPESIRMGRRKVGFSSPMPDWLNGPLASWTRSLLQRDVPLFSDLVDEARLNSVISDLTARQAWDWQSSFRIWPYLNMKWMLSRLPSG